jgi:hypothetical protein
MDAGGGKPLRADRPSVIDEVFDGEAVVVHLGTGSYYALNAAATQVWELVREGTTPSRLVETVSERSGEEAGRLASSFLGELIEEKLLVACDEADVVDSRQMAGDGREAWRGPPELRRFDDLQELLLVDPIHDVSLGADGWPVPAES